MTFSWDDYQRRPWQVVKGAALNTRRLNGSDTLVPTTGFFGGRDSDWPCGG